MFKYLSAFLGWNRKVKFNTGHGSAILGCLFSEDRNLYSKPFLNRRVQLFHASAAVMLDQKYPGEVERR